MPNKELFNKVLEAAVKASIAEAIVETTGEFIPPNRLEELDL